MSSETERELTIQELAEEVIAFAREGIARRTQAVFSDCDWRAHGGVALDIAQTIRDERRHADLPILADALEEAGCTDIEILDHCHRAEEHPIGCWVIDLLL